MLFLSLEGIFDHGKTHNANEHQKNRQDAEEPQSSRQENASGWACHWGCQDPPAPSASPPMGSRMVNVVPLPISLSKVRAPPCRVTMMDRAMASPWPVPLPTSLVVKKGSKTRWRMASGIPAPVSEISIRTILPSCAVLM